jgi:hypothetical protein
VRVVGKTAKAWNKNITHEDRIMIRELHREYLRLHGLRREIEGKILDLMDERDVLLKQIEAVSPKTLAEKYDTVPSMITYILRARSTSSV